MQFLEIKYDTSKILQPSRQTVSSSLKSWDRFPLFFHRDIWDAWRIILAIWKSKRSEEIPTSVWHNNVQRIKSGKNRVPVSSHLNDDVPSLRSCDRDAHSGEIMLQILNLLFLVISGHGGQLPFSHLIRKGSNHHGSMLWAGKRQHSAGRVH